MEPLLLVFRELLRVHRRAPFTNDQARAVGVRLGVEHVKVRRLLSDMVEDGATLFDSSSVTHAFVPPSHAVVRKVCVVPSN